MLDPVFYRFLGVHPHSMNYARCSRCEGIFQREEPIVEVVIGRSKYSTKKFGCSKQAICVACADEVLKDNGEYRINKLYKIKSKSCQLQCQ